MPSIYAKTLRHMNEKPSRINRTYRNRNRQKKIKPNLINIPIPENFENVSNAANNLKNYARNDNLYYQLWNAASGNVTIRKQNKSMEGPFYGKNVTIHGKRYEILRRLSRKKTQEEKNENERREQERNKEITERLKREAEEYRKSPQYEKNKRNKEEKIKDIEERLEAGEEVSAGEFPFDYEVNREKYKKVITNNVYVHYKKRTEPKAENE